MSSQAKRFYCEKCLQNFCDVMSVILAFFVVFLKQRFVNIAYMELRHLHQITFFITGILTLVFKRRRYNQHFLAIAGLFVVIPDT